MELERAYVLYLSPHLFLWFLFTVPSPFRVDSAYDLQISREYPRGSFVFHLYGIAYRDVLRRSFIFGQAGLTRCFIKSVLNLSRGSQLRSSDSMSVLERLNENSSTMEASESSERRSRRVLPLCGRESDVFTPNELSRWAGAFYRRVLGNTVTGQSATKSMGPVSKVVRRSCTHKKTNLWHLRAVRLARPT